MAAAIRLFITFEEPHSYPQTEAQTLSYPFFDDTASTGLSTPLHAN